MSSPSPTTAAPTSAIDAFFPEEVATSLRRMITLSVYQSQLPKRIAMLATMRREGVTTTALALGGVIASDLVARVCVVELNWYAPGVLAACSGEREPAPKKVARWPQPWRNGEPAPDLAAKRPPAPGIAEVLKGQATLDEAIVRTDLPRLSVIPAGELAEAERPRVSRGQALRELLGEVEAQFDYLLLDLPAVLYTSDAIALASLADTGCLVIRQGVTPLPTVQSALDELKHLPMLGAVLNRTRTYTPRLIRQFIPQD